MLITALRGETLLYLPKRNFDGEIEEGYKQIKRFIAQTTSTDFVLRFFYFAFACLLYLLWQLIDHLIQVYFTDSFTDDP